MGDYEVPEEGYVVITDAGNGSSFGLSALEQDDDHVVLDLGEEYGEADLGVCDIADAVDAISEVDVDGQFVS